jgi:hypothetical protein
MDYFANMYQRNDGIKWDALKWRILMWAKWIFNGKSRDISRISKGHGAFFLKRVLVSKEGPRSAAAMFLRHIQMSR